MTYYVMLGFNDSDGIKSSFTAMYPFVTEQEMLDFKDKLDRVFNDTYCDCCNRIDPDDAEEYVRNEGYL